jgi:hypothetical protein
MHWPPKCFYQACGGVQSIMNFKPKALLASSVFALAMGTYPVAAAAPAQNEIPLRYAVSNGSTQPQYVETATRRRYFRSRYRTTRNGRYTVKTRSKAKSAAIIGGSAAGGAAIGALAGGGKGAAIGALVGGGGGLIYDRKTHKKVYRNY